MREDTIAKTDDVSKVIDTGHREPGSYFNAFSEEWEIRKRVFADGQMEIVAKKYDRYEGVLQFGSPSPHTKRGEAEDRENSIRCATERAKQRVRLLCKTMGADRMLTLTYRENMTDRVRAKRDFDRFRRAMSKHRSFKYVCTMEQQERGAWHFHIAVKGRLVYQLVRSIWRKVVGQDNGTIHVSNPYGRRGGQHKLAAYLSKYITKNAALFELNEKRYWCSKGIDVPEPERVAYYAHAKDVAEIMAECLTLANREGNPLDLQAYYDKHSMFWMATGPLCRVE
ncbi:hypothetical protein [Cupriavidus metallidurans]|uniref:rolling circle replication-associated protein n=1 Tax=Cupriavidus metallidurans TaxID=119219 RepID=UPI001BFC35B7|nr:hypothetical protein [Cupriavidus metallidurans]QWC89297.1 hypothetical protein KB891_03580 [Cupriavidus metallidurans]